MAHLSDMRLPEGIEVGAVYGPEYVTEVAPMTSGKEKRNRTRDALCVGDLSFAPTLEADYPALLRFFRIANGRFNSFCFKDYSDFACALTEGVAVAISATTFQLYKKYAVGSHTELRAIQAPLAAGFVLKHSGTTLTLTSQYTLDAATGIITTAASDYAAGDLTWSGEFDNVVRFDTDRMATNFTAAQVFTWGGIPIKEVPL